MKQIIVFLTISASLSILSMESPAWSEERVRSVTPYGDSCTKCGKYGSCENTMTDHDAERALKDYYDEKKLNIKIEKKWGRFIRAKIYDKKDTVDIIIFDRQTGRIRSIY